MIESLVSGERREVSNDSIVVVIQQPPKAGLDFATAIAWLPAAIVAVVGYWIVHSLSKLRQRRDETFKLCQAARDLTAEAAQAALKVWDLPANSKKRSSEFELALQKFGRLGRYLGMLRERDKKLDVSANLLAFRRRATTDIEDAGAITDQLRAEILLAADQLEEAIDKAFLKKYG